MIQNLIFILTASLILSACASSSPITEVGQGKYMVTSHTSMCVDCAPGAQSIKTAKAHCSSKGLNFELVNSSSGTNMYGYKTNNEMIFKCIK